MLLMAGQEGIGNGKGGVMTVTADRLTKEAPSVLDYQLVRSVAAYLIAEAKRCGDERGADALVYLFDLVEQSVEEA